MVESKLNILHIDTEKYWRGGQQQVFYLHEGLIKRKINSVLICNKSSKLKERCKAAKLPYKEISMLGELDFISAIRISRICKKSNIQIIQAHSAHAVTLGIMVKLLVPNLKLIAVRRVDFSISKNFLSRKKYNTKKIDIIICISDFIKSVLINDGIDEKKLTTVRSGTDIHKFDGVFVEEDFREKLGVLKDEFLIGTVAAFAGHKDYPNLLRAFSIVAEKLDDVKLCIVGDGPLKNEIIKMVNEYKITGKVIMPGFREDVGKFLKSFDLFVLASKKEGLGTSIIDAMALGLPIISTETGGIPELIKNGKNGILVKPGDSIKLAESIATLVNDKDLRIALGDNAKTSSSEHSVKKTIENNIDLYKKLLN